MVSSSQPNHSKGGVMKIGRLRHVIAALSVIALAATMVLFVSTASARSLHPKGTYVYNDMVLMGVDLWNCAPFDPTPTKCMIVANLNNDTVVQMTCWADFPPAWKGGNYPSVRWFKIKYSGSRKAWVHSSFVYHQTKVGHC